MLEETSQSLEPATPVAKPRLVLLARWATINGGIAWCAWAGVHGNIGAGRLLVFAAWVCGTLQLLAGMTGAISQESAKNGRPVPAMLSHGFGITVMCFMAWHGWWWTAVAFVLAEIGEAALFSKQNATSLAAPPP